MFSIGGCVQSMHACPHPAWCVPRAICHKNGSPELGRRKWEIMGEARKGAAACRGKEEGGSEMC